MFNLLLQIVTHTPTWVWGLLAGLVALGWTQLQDREMSLTRITVLPLVMLALSFAGVVSTFAHATLALIAWVVGVAVSLTAGRQIMQTRGAYRVPGTNRVFVPGSWLPMVLIIALFLIKYGVGVAIAMNHGLTAHTGFGVACGVAYGLFSGLFAARAHGLRSLAAASTQNALA